MYEYGITNNATGEEDIIFGNWLEDAFRRSKLNPAEWSVWYSEYVD